MAKFKEFLERLESDKNLKLAKPETHAIANIVSTQITASSLSISNNDREKFSSEVAQLANSESVMSELSDSIGVPKNHESEEDFVKRAKSSLKNILMRKLEK